MLNEYLWYDKLWGPSQRVVTLLLGVDHHDDHDQVGKLMMASGGRRQGRALRSVEAMLPDGGKGERWFFFFPFSSNPLFFSIVWLLF